MSSGASTASALLGERLLVAEAGDVAQHVVQRHEREAEREAAEREAQQLQREASCCVGLRRVMRSRTRHRHDDERHVERQRHQPEQDGACGAPSRAVR